MHMTILWPTGIRILTLINTLQDEISVLLKWFKENSIKTNPSKFHTIALGKKACSKKPVLRLMRLKSFVVKPLN